jgi:hypothetical protein
MRSIYLIFLLASAALSAGAAAAQSTSAEGPGLAVTIYADNLALVQDARTLDITGGRQRIEFKGVSAQIRPETVSLSADGLSVVEQNFDYDLLTPAKMMQKAVGRTVTLVRVNPATGAETREEALVLADNDGVVLKIGDRIEVLRDDGLPARVIFDKVPENLRATPTLSITVDGKGAGQRPGVLSYLTPGLGWRADYVALFDEAAGKIDVQGWVTLTNTSGTTYDDARTVLVAGSPNVMNTGDGQDGGFVRPFGPPRPTMEQAGTESGTRERLGDFYLYPLPERTTIANQQTKQVSFLDVRGAPASHGYEYRLGWMQTIEQPQSAQSVYRFSTSASGGLGDQLPAGVVRFYLRDRQGAPQFIGESPIDHTPMGSTLSLATGDAFDVKIKSAVEKREAFGLLRWKTSMRYTLTNALPHPVTVALIQNGLWGDTKVAAESQPGKRVDADSSEWDVAVPANGQAEVTATFDSKF